MRDITIAIAVVLIIWAVTLPPSARFAPLPTGPLPAVNVP
jgi:hypothetical protein